MGSGYHEVSGARSKALETGRYFRCFLPSMWKEDRVFKDNVHRGCESCGTHVTNPKIDFGCAEWCTYAEQCVGNLPGEVKEKRRDFFRERIASEMRKVFGKDRKRINHANKVVRFAEEILRGEGAIQPLS